MRNPGKPIDPSLFLPLQDRNANTGQVIAVGHPLEGQSLKDRVLVIRSTKGSSATPMVLNLAQLEGTAPVAFVNVEVDSLAALGCIVNGIPMVTDLERNPFDAIRTGDYVEVDADAGLVRVRLTRPPHPAC